MIDSMMRYINILQQAIYQSFGGGQKGIVYKDLICGLVLLVYGTKKEKAQCK